MIAGLGIIARPHLPAKSIEEEEPLPSDEQSSPDETELPQKISKKAVRSILPTPETPENEQLATFVSSNHPKESTPSPNSGPNKRRRSNESQISDGSPIIPPHFPPNPDSRADRAGDIFWLNACMEVQRPDGTVHAPDVIVRLMTRKGGIANPWPRLEEGLAAIESMKKDMIDPAEIRRRQEEEDAIIRAKEQRRLANKYLYRPRGQIDKERAERRAALAAQNAKELESTSANTTPQQAS
ncbi:hypothetical protein ACLX1H_002328 [Fusarium chlamydosporum]